MRFGKGVIAGMFLGLALLSSEAAAQTRVYETASGSGTVRSVRIVNTGSTNIDVSSRALAGRFTAEIWNDDSANNLFCSFSVDVSSETGNLNYGRRVGPRSSWTIAVPDSMKIYCTSDVAAGLWAVCTQLK